MDIKISHTWPKIGIQTQRAQLNLKNNGKTDHVITNTAPQLQINSTDAKVYIDQTQCFADAGLKGIEDFAAEVTQLAKSATMEYIQRETRQGDSFTKTYNKNARPMLDAAREEMTRRFDYNIGLVPSHRPEITIQEGQLDIQLIQGQVDVQYNHVPIEGEYIPAQIRFYMEQVGSLDIEYVGSNVDTKV